MNFMTNVKVAGRKGYYERDKWILITSRETKKRTQVTLVAKPSVSMLKNSFLWKTWARITPNTDNHIYAKIMLTIKTLGEYAKHFLSFPFYIFVLTILGGWGMPEIWGGGKVNVNLFGMIFLLVFVNGVW